MTQAREMLIVGLGAALLFGGGVCVGRTTAPAGPVRTVTVTEEKIVEKWATKTETAAETTATAEKTETVRVVTRWLRPDKTVAKEQVTERGSATTTNTSAVSVSHQSAHHQSSRESESRTVVDLRPRIFAQGLLGLDLGHGLERRWGGAVSVRIAGPVWVGAWVLPGMRVGGASLGVTW